MNDKAIGSPSPTDGSVSLSSQPFVLTPDLSTLDKSCWSIFLEDTKTNSYSYILDRSNRLFPVTQLDQWFHQLHPLRLAKQKDKDDDGWTDSYYKGEKLLRKTAWVVLDDNCRCEYGYSDTWQPIVPSTTTLHKIVQDMTHHVQQVTGDLKLNCCNLNYYPRGGGVGFHADDEFLFDSTNRPTRIVSLSLCDSSETTQRLFQVKPQNTGLTEQRAANDDFCSDDTPLEISLRHGDLITMEGMFQKHYLHSIWPGDSKDFLDHPNTQGERINLTWRTIVQHLDGSDQCRKKRCPLLLDDKL